MLPIRSSFRGRVKRGFFSLGLARSNKICAEFLPPWGGGFCGFGLWMTRSQPVGLLV